MWHWRFSHARRYCAVLGKDGRHGPKRFLVSRLISQFCIHDRDCFPQTIQWFEAQWSGVYEYILGPATVSKNSNLFILRREPYKLSLPSITVDVQSEKPKNPLLQRFSRTQDIPSNIVHIDKNHNIYIYMYDTIHVSPSVSLCFFSKNWSIPTFLIQKPIVCSPVFSAKVGYPSSSDLSHWFILRDAARHFVDIRKSNMVCQNRNDECFE